MATFSLGNVPSPINQAMRLAQLNELQNPNLALERDIQKAVQIQQLQQQSPEGQLALQIKQAQLNAALQNQAFEQQQRPLEQQKQAYILEQLKNALDPTYQAKEDARKLAFDVDRATQIANATAEAGSFDANSGRRIQRINGRWVATPIPLAESLEVSAPTVSASDIPSFDPTLFSGTPAIPTTPAPSPRLLTGTIEERAKADEDRRKEDRAFRAEESKLNREFLKGKQDKMRGYDTVTGTFGVFAADENGMFPEGVVPATNAPKPEKLKTPSTTQVDQLSGLDILSSKIEELKKTPASIVASNVGWLDSLLGGIQSATGLGTASSVKQNEAFRTAVDTLIGEYSFGRGGKSLTVNEREILGKYLPSLSNSDSAFASRLESFGNLVKELKSSKLSALEDSGYNVSRFGTQPSGQGGATSKTPVSISTKQERDALQSGTQYVGPDGKIATKQ